MSAFLEPHRLLLDRRNTQVLQTIMESQRASVIEKQEAELTLLRTELNYETMRKDELLDMHLETNRELVVARRRNIDLDDLVDRYEALHLKLRGNIEKIVNDYWSLIDDSMEASIETKENARGQKRKLPAAQRLQLMEKILIEHMGKRMRAVGDAVRAGSSTYL